MTLTFQAGPQQSGLEDRLHPPTRAQGAGQLRGQPVQELREGPLQAGLSLRVHLHPQEDRAPSPLEATTLRALLALEEVRTAGGALQDRRAQPHGSAEDAPQGTPERETAQQQD